jgi:hypothetical protein
MKDAETKLSLKYHGKAVETGRLNIYDAAATMLAFSEFVTEAGRVVFGPKVELRAQVEGFRSGSFVTDIMFQVIGPAMPLLAHADVAEWLKTIKTAFELWKHLKGSPAKEITTDSSVKGDNNISVTNHDGKVLIVNTQSLQLVMSEKGAEAVERFVGTQLNVEDLDGVEILKGRTKLAAASRSEAAYFRSVTSAIPVTDNTFEYALSIDAPVFKEGNKWRFSDGGSSFFADIEDDEFIQRVNAGEAFAKGDALRVMMRIEQERKGSELMTNRKIIKVLEHIRQQSTGKLF